MSNNEDNTSSDLQSLVIENIPLTTESSKSRIKDHYHIILGCTNNILSSVSIILINKYIFSHFHISTLTLTTIHMIFTSIGLLICLKFNTFVHKKVPLKKVFPLSIIFCIFVVFTNLSLEYNRIGTYQLFKNFTTPSVVFISYQYYNIKYSKIILITLIPLIIGISIHSINDIELTLFGTIIAIIGFLSATFYQIWISERLKDLEMNSQQLLYYQAPLSALVLLPLIILIEHFPSYSTNEQLRIAIGTIVLSSIIAFVTNLSVYWVIQNTSTLTYNMISHLKTISVLIGGIILFNENLNLKQFIGILLTFFGLFSYTFIRMREENQLSCRFIGTESQ